MNYLKICAGLYKMRRQARMGVAGMKKLQDEKLRRLLHAAWDNSAYYRKAFEEAGIKKEELDTLPLSCFPSLDKKQLFGHFSELVTETGLDQENLRKFDESETIDKNFLS